MAVVLCQLVSAYLLSPSKKKAPYNGALNPDFDTSILAFLGQKVKLF